jgi:hypothetical protein
MAKKLLNRTKVLIMEIFTEIARGLFKTDESIAIPHSEKTKGKYLRPPHRSPSGSIAFLSCSNVNGILTRLFSLKTRNYPEIFF